MAGIDKIYLTKEQNVLFKKWLKKNQKEIMDLTGYNPFNHDYGYDSDESYVENVFNFPTYINIYLSQNCPLEFIQNRLKEQYGDDYIKSLDVLPSDIFEEFIYDYIVNQYQGDVTKIRASDLEFLEKSINNFKEIIWGHYFNSKEKRKGSFIPRGHFGKDEILDYLFLFPSKKVINHNSNGGWRKVPYIYEIRNIINDSLELLNTIQDKYETNKTIFEDKYYSLSIKIFIERKIRKIEIFYEDKIILRFLIKNKRIEIKELGEIHQENDLDKAKEKIIDNIIDYHGKIQLGL